MFFVEYVFSQNFEVRHIFRYKIRVSAGTTIPGSLGGSAPGLEFFNNCKICYVIHGISVRDMLVFYG